jgi:hypothetical protein
MSVGLICPSCHAAATFHRVPIRTCPNCHASLPESLTLTAEASLLQRWPGRLSSLWGCTWLPHLAQSV